MPIPSGEATTSFNISERFSAHRIQLVLDYLAVSYSEPLSTARMSALVGLSPSRFSHMFKEQAGLAPMQYVKLLRLKRASELLQTTCMSVKEVMFKVGLSDASHFVRDFRRLYGVTPGQHRAALLVGAATEPTGTGP
jgi:AraC-like DNA-binding protein